MIPQTSLYQQAISVVGSTGSIGRQTLQVLEQLGLRPVALAAGSDVKGLEAQCRRYVPAYAALADESAARDLRVRLADAPTRVGGGEEAVCEAAAYAGVHSCDDFTIGANAANAGNAVNAGNARGGVALIASAGLAGFKPTLAAVGNVRRVALANKETMVCAGRLVMQRLAGSGTELLPVDSELSAIHACLDGIPRERMSRVIITASGGPFYGRGPEDLRDVTAEDALRHPTWKMGKKITIDSATMLNKGYEFIEAMNYFGLPYGLIEIGVHRQSLIHAIVEYTDRNPYFYIDSPDMRIPIQYALTYPERPPRAAEPIGLFNMPPLTLERPNMQAYPCLALALSAARRGGYYGAALAAAGEAAVSRFLAGSLRFTGIAECVEAALASVQPGEPASIEDVLAADAAARAIVNEML